MSLQSKKLKFGKIEGFDYLFEKEGDLLPMHDHVKGGAHISIASKGSFICTGDFPTFVMNTGDIINWKAETAHQFEAEKDDSRLVNLTK